MRKFIFIIFLLLGFVLNSQNTSNWNVDINLIESKLNQNYLFSKISKQEFHKRIQLLNNKNLDVENLFWELNQLLGDIPNISLSNIEFERFPFKIKQFEDKYYITGIHADYNDFLGLELVEINDFLISDIVSKTKKLSQINIKSFLCFYKYNDAKTLKLTLLTKENTKVTITLPLLENSLEELVSIIPKQKLFYLQKSNRWFWMYGINFGQQVYFKYNIGLGKEFIQKTMDSLQISEKAIANNYHLSLQEIYDAPTFDDFTKKLFLKFKKRRYKKLFIDLRNHKTGNVKAFSLFLEKLKNYKRINKKTKLYILIDRNLSSSAIETVLKLKKNTNCTIIGENVSGISCSSDKIKRTLLPNTNFTIEYPTQYFKTLTLQPDITIITTFSHYKSGIDPILQKAMN